VPREVAERLGARAIREGKHLDPVVLEVLEDGANRSADAAARR